MNCLKVFVLILLWTFCNSLSAQVYFVKSDGNGDGSSWSDASSDLRSTLLRAQDGEEIWVAVGVYTPVVCSNCTEFERLISFEIPSGVKVYGGFLGNETIRSQRNISLNKTILSGDIDQDGTLSNNSYSVVSTMKVNTSTLLDGFTVTMGNADKIGDPWGSRNNSGGAWFNDGALDSSRSNPEIRNCHFVNNYAAGFGGAIYHDGSFTGQAISVNTNNIFENNSSGEGGGAVYHNCSFEGLSKSEYRRCYFLGNYSDNSGGAVYTNAIYGTDLSVFENCIFRNNSVESYGGAIYNLGKQGVSTPAITNCLFTENQATAGAGVYNLGAEGGNASPIITNCTFTKNTADVGVGIYNQAVDFSGNVSPVIQNSIFWANNSGYGQVLQNGHATPSISYCLVDVPSCTELNTGINSSVNCGDGMIFNQDPLFADTVSDNFKLLLNSPAIDKGNNQAINSIGSIQVDLDSADRIFNQIVDLGAYEYIFVYDFPSLSLDATSEDKCEGETLSWSVNVNGTGPFHYQWFKDSIEINSAITEAFVISAAEITDSGDYYCRVNNEFGDTVVSDIIQLTIAPVKRAEVELVTSDTSLCSGDQLTLEAVSVNGGGSPSYQWLQNGQPVGEDNYIYQPESFQDGDLYQVQMASSENCLLENPVLSNLRAIQVIERDTASLSISASDLSLCVWDSVFFEADLIASIVNLQTFVWQVNGVEADRGNVNWRTVSVMDGDIVRGMYVPTGRCTSPDTLYSNEIQLEVDPLIEVAVLLDFHKDSICIGDTAVFSASAFNPGNQPVYEWYINGIPQGINDTIFTTNTLSDGDTVWCSMISSEPCPIDSIVYSRRESVHVAECIISGISDRDLINTIQINPNPTRGQIQFVPPSWLQPNMPFIVELVDPIGTRLTSMSLDNTSNTLLDFSNYPSGLYWLIVRQKEQWGTARISIFR